MSKKTVKVQYNNIVKKLDFPNSIEDLKQYATTNFEKNDDFDFQFEEEKSSRLIYTDEDLEEVKLSSNKVPKIKINVIPKEKISLKDNIETKNDSFDQDLSDTKNDNILPLKNDILTPTSDNEDNMNNNYNNNINEKIHETIVSIVKEKMEKLEKDIINDIYNNIQTTETTYLLNNNNNNNNNKDENVQISMINDNITSLSIHKGIKCNGCNCNEIVGPRFKCIICQDFNLCSKCEKNNKHDIDHILLKIYHPDSDENIQNFPKYKVEGFNYSINESHFNFDKNKDNIINVVIKNTGKLNWRSGFMLHCLNEYSDLRGESVSIKSNLECGDEEEISIKFGVTYNKGNLLKKDKKDFISSWQMFNENDLPFGEVFQFFIKIN